MHHVSRPWYAHTGRMPNGLASRAAISERMKSVLRSGLQQHHQRLLRTIDVPQRPGGVELEALRAMHRVIRPAVIAVDVHAQRGRQHRVIQRGVEMLARPRPAHRHRPPPAPCSRPPSPRRDGHRNPSPRHPDRGWRPRWPRSPCEIATFTSSGWFSVAEIEHADQRAAVLRVGILGWLPGPLKPL